MDVSTFVFYHCDLGPTNLLVDTSTGSLGIIDWELAGYNPIEWVRTKFRLSAGMDFNRGDDDSKRTGAAGFLSTWKGWATAMLWMHGGSFRTASSHWSYVWTLLLLTLYCPAQVDHLYSHCFRPRLSVPLVSPNKW